MPTGKFDTHNRKDPHFKIGYNSLQSNKQHVFDNKNATRYNDTFVNAIFVTQLEQIDRISVVRITFYYI